MDLDGGPVPVNVGLMEDLVICGRNRALRFAGSLVESCE
jgi:hypothetical protein